MQIHPLQSHYADYDGVTGAVTDAPTVGYYKRQLCNPFATDALRFPKRRHDVVEVIIA